MKVTRKQFMKEEKREKMSSAKKYVLDTNVLLTDSNIFETLKNKQIIIPFIVLEELDKAKTRMDDAGKNAREVIRKIKQDHLKNVSVLSISDLKATTKQLPADFISDAKNDNKILEFCLKCKNSVLVTRDAVMEVKAKVLGIPCEEYKTSTTGEQEPGSDLVNQLYSGVTVINDHELVASLEDLSEIILPTEIVEKFSLQLNQFVVLQDPGVKTIFCQFLGKTKPLRIVDSNKFNSVKPIPKNKEQEFAYQLLFDNSLSLVSLIGLSGTGKTLLALGAGLEQVLNRNKYESLVICRPTQPVGNDIGFLPGEISEKLDPWTAPIKDNLRFILSKGKRGKDNDMILQELIDRGIIEIQAMTFIRGRSIQKAFIIIDEAQNLSPHELKTILTRAGEGSKIVLTGDIEQIDAKHLDTINNGLTVAIEAFKGQQIYGHVTLIKGERSQLATLASRVL